MARIVPASSFLRFFTAFSVVTMISLLGSVLEVTENLRPFAKRSVSIWVDCLKDMLITHFVLSVILAALGTSEKLRRIIRSNKMRSTFYTESTLHKLFCKPKDRVATEDKTVSFMRLTVVTVK